MFSTLKKIPNHVLPQPPSDPEEIKVLKNRIAELEFALRQYASHENWSIVSCWGVKLSRRWKGQFPEQHGYSLAEQTLSKTRKTEL